MYRNYRVVRICRVGHSEVRALLHNCRCNPLEECQDIAYDLNAILGSDRISYIVEEVGDD